jgi:hypothetical protein
VAGALLNAAGFAIYAWAASRYGPWFRSSSADGREGNCHGTSNS